MTDYTGLADNPLERDPLADAITAGGTERSRPSPPSSPRRSITNGIDYGADDVVAVFKIIASANGCMNPPQPPDLRCKALIKISATRRPHAWSMTSALVAESVTKRLRPLYATGFIHSFVLWYSIEKLFMRSVGLNDYLITIATLVYIVVMMTANIPLGLLADRWSRKGVLYIATCALIGSSLVCGFSHGLALYATGISVWGLFYAAYAGTYDSAVYDVVLEETGSAEAFEHCYGRVQMFEATAFISSALASAVVAHYASLRVEYFLTIPFTCCAFLTLSRFREPRLHRTVPRAHLGAHLGRIVRGATGGNVGWIVVALVANCVVMRLLIEFYQLWYLGLALPVLWYGPACALMYSGAWSGGALANRLRGGRAVPLAGLGTLVIAFGLFVRDPRVVVGAQVATIFGVTVLNIALTRYLHDAMPSTVRAGASSVVSTIGYGVFVPTALAFGILSRGHGIFAASVLVVAPLAVMCVSVARARRGSTQPARLPEALGQLAEIAAAQEQLRQPAGGRPVGSGPARGRSVTSVPAAPYSWPADRARQPGVAGPKVNRVGDPAKSLASRAWQRPGRPGDGAGIAWAGSAAQGQPLRADRDRPGPVPLGAPVSAGPVPGLAAAPAAGGQPPEWWEGDGQEWGWPGVGDGEEWDGGEQVLAGTEGPPPPDAARIRPWPASLRDPGGTGLREPPRGAGRRPARRRVAIVAVAVIAPLLAAAVLVLAPPTRHSPGTSRAAAGQQGYQAGSAAPAALPALTYPGQQQRGVFAAIGRIVASRNTIVAIGSQATGSVVRQQFFVSTDGGTTWRLAPVRGPGGGQPPVGYPAARVAGGPAGWLAVGPQATWTSPSGLSWTLSRAHGITPVLPGDQMWVLNSTSDGFLAGGVARGGNGAAQGVIWTSRDGLTWQRKTAAQLGLARRGQTVRRISYITSRGEDTVMSGTVIDRRCSPVPKTLHRRTRTVTCRSRSYSAAWLSTDGGSAWTPVIVPAGHGAGARIAGVGFDRSGLVAVRPGRSSSGRGDGVAYFSPNGRAWHYAATIAAAGGWSPSLVKGSGYGFVVTGASVAGRILAYTSTGTGTSWRPTAPLGAAASERVSGATVAPGGTIIAIGSTAASKVSQRPVFLEAIAGNGMVRQISLTGIPGAVVPELTVNGLATAGGQQVAGGSADGYPAVWRKAAGHPWSLVTSLAQVSAGQSLRTLTAVTHGRAGWLAVGAPGPAVFTSANGTAWQPDGPAADDLAGVTAAVAAAGPAGYVIVGKLPAPGQASAVGVWWSPDLTSWTRACDVNDVSGSNHVLAVAAGAHGFVAAGSHDGQPAVWTSANGRRWTAIVLPLPAGASGGMLRQVAINGNHVAALGQETTALGSVPLAEVSADGGATWTRVPFSAPGAAMAFTALTADADGFTAAAQFGSPGRQRAAIWTSANGTTWLRKPANGLTGSPKGDAHQIDALAPAGQAVIGIASVTTQQSQQFFAVTLPGHRPAQPGVAARGTGSGPEEDRPEPASRRAAGTAQQRPLLSGLGRFAGPTPSR